MALDPERHITELAHRVWDTKSGVPADIRALAQTIDGYLWVGSLRGLYRFDGIQFQKFESESGAQLPSQQIWRLFAARGNRLWIGYNGGGVSVLEAGKLTNYNSADGFPKGIVLGFAEDQQGRIWAASADGLACFEGGRWRTVGSESGFPGSGAQAILVDHHGALWVAGEQRIAVLHSNASHFELADEPYHGQVTQLVEGPDGTVWMVESTRAVRPLKRPDQGIPFRGLTKDDCQNKFPDTWKTEPLCRRAEDLEVRVGSEAVLFDQDGSFWISTLGDGLRRAPYPSQLSKEPIGEFSDALEQFTNKDGLSSDIAHAILEDREGNIWVATPDGIDQFRNSVLAPVRLGPAVAQLSIASDKNGYVVAQNNQSNFFRFHDSNNKTAFHMRNGPQTTIWLYRDPFGSIWGTGPEGSCRLVDDECATRLEVPGAKKLLFSRFWRVAMDGNHRLWAYVAEEGLFELANGRWMPYSGTAPAPTSAVPLTQYTDPSGRIWFGFRDGRLLTVTNGLARVYSPEDGLTIGAIRAIASDGTHVWVGGAGGLTLLRERRFASVSPYDMPAFGSISGVVTADDGSLWLNESRGVVRVAPSEVSALLQDSSHPTHYDLLTSVDGLPAATEQFNSPTAIRGTDGRLWFAATNGAAWVDPRRLYRNALPPPVFIQSLVADGRPLSPSGKIELPAPTNNLQIAYSGLSLSVPERVQFRYRLGGLEDNWQSAGTRRTAYYTRLPPGSYDFQVIASNDAGVWNTVGAHLPIRIIPAWYQTWWFYALCAFLAVAVLAALYRLRLEQVRADTRRLLEARLSERERIARDLHDTLLQGMQGLIWRFEAATNRIPLDQPARKLMEQSLERADKLLGESRDRVKDLRPVGRDVVDLAQALAAEGAQFAQLGRAELRVSVQGTPRDLHPVVREEGLLIAREALYNAFRHSGAKDVEVEVNYGEAALLIRVRDDGRGIGKSVLDAGGRAGHFGLTGMRERAEKLGAELQILSRPGIGTEIDLRVPAKVAYRTGKRPFGFRWWNRAAHTLLKITPRASADT